MTIVCYINQNADTTVADLDDIRAPWGLHQGYLFILPGLGCTVQVLVRHGLPV